MYKRQEEDEEGNLFIHMQAKAGATIETTKLKLNPEQEATLFGLHSSSSSGPHGRFGQAQHLDATSMFTDAVHHADGTTGGELLAEMIEGAEQAVLQEMKGSRRRSSRRGSFADYTQDIAGALGNESGRPGFGASAMSLLLSPFILLAMILRGCMGRRKVVQTWELDENEDGEVCDLSLIHI